jgi:glycosyltransferase involved in cell wall biosynthesis
MELRRSGSVPLRIGFDLRRMHRTGIGRYARNIFTAVAAEAPEHAYVVVVQDERDAAWVRAAVPTARCVVAPAAQYSMREMFRTPEVGAVDVFHCPHPYHLALGAAHPSVLTLLDLIQITHAIGVKNAIAREPLRAIIRASCRRAERFVVISEATREIFHEMMGVPRDRVHLTRLAPDPHFARPVNPAAVVAARERWGLGDRVVLYVGMTQPHKNLDRLLQAVALLARDRPSDSVQVGIVGPVVPAERAALEARMDHLDITERVRLLGWLSDDDVLLAFHAAAVVALPSLAEGFGLTLLEAMQCGTPCVASALPVLREVAGDAAVFVEPLSPESIAGGLREVLDDAALASELRTRGRRNLSRFSWQQAARDTLAAYEAAARR